MKKSYNILIGALIVFGGGTAAAQTPKAILRQLAASQLGLDTSNVSVALTGKLALSGTPADYTFKFAAVPRGRTVVRASSPEHRSVAFTVRVDIWEDVLVARVPLARGATLNPNDFITVRREVTHVTPAGASALSTKRTRRRISAGSVLVADVIEGIPDVKFGDRVTLVAVSGAVRVTRRGVALKDARIGESVRVRLDKHTIIPATVTGPRVCEVGP